MSKRPFLIGDRVAVYTGGKRYTGRLDSQNDDGAWIVEIPEQEAYATAHPLQIRRLVKKPLLRVWLLKSLLAKGDGQTGMIYQTPRYSELSSELYTEFVEVRKKK